MKKIYSLIFIFSVSVLAVNAQESITGLTATPVKKNFTKGVSPMSIDTLWPASFTPNAMMCDTHLVFYNLQAPASGYAFGNNSLPEIECAQKYYSSGTVSKVIVLYGTKAGTTGSTSVKLYSVDGTTKGPSATVLGTSAVVTTGNVSTAGFTDYMFSPAVTVATSFVASVVFPTTTGDTVAVASTVLGCATADSLSWENFPSFGGWKSTKVAFGPANNLELCIFPVVNTTNGITEFPSSMGLTLMGSYPNPAKDQTTIRYNIANSTSVAVTVFDLTGRVISQTSEKLTAGTHELKVDLKNIPSGNYYYSVKTDETRLTSEFSVVK